MVQCKIGGYRGREILISVKGYEIANPENIDDANWLNCSVAVYVGAFQGELQSTFTIYDFIRFSSELQKILSKECSRASFQTDEEALLLNIDITATGKTVINGILKEQRYGTSELRFSFDSDLSYLPEIQKSLQRIISYFPERLGT